VKKLAEQIIQKVNNIQEINGRSPISIAAAAIYLAAEASGNARTYDEISAIAGAAVTTIKSTLKQMQMSNLTINTVGNMLANLAITSAGSSSLPAISQKVPIKMEKRVSN
jgi:hypothetical protein